MKLATTCFLLAGACFGAGIAYVGMGVRALQAENANEVWEKAAKPEPATKAE